MQSSGLDRKTINSSTWKFSNHRCTNVLHSNIRAHSAIRMCATLFFSLLHFEVLLKYCTDAWQHVIYLLESGHTCNLGLPWCKNLWIFSLFRGYRLCALYCLGLLLIVLCFTSLVSFTGFYTKDEPVISCKFIWLVIQKGCIGLYNKEKIMQKMASTNS